MFGKTAGEALVDLLIDWGSRTHIRYAWRFHQFYH